MVVVSRYPSSHLLFLQNEPTMDLNDSPLFGISYLSAALNTKGGMTLRRVISFFSYIYTSSVLRAANL